MQSLEELASKKDLPMAEGRWESASCPQDGRTTQTQLEQQVSTAAAAASAPSAPFLRQLCPPWSVLPHRKGNRVITSPTALPQGIMATPCSTTRHTRFFAFKMSYVVV